MQPSFNFQGKPYQAILFDMDGTLIDNMMVHHEAWRVALANHGVHMTLEQVKEEIHGVNHEILERLFGNTFSKEQAIKFAFQKEAAYRKIYADDIKLIAGSDAFLEEALKLHIPMAIATAAPVENVDFVLKMLPIKKYFSVVKHAGDVERGKPDPQVFQLTAEALGVDVRECLVFEDSVTGAMAAKNAEAQSVIITTTHSEHEFGGIEGIQLFSNNYEKLTAKLSPAK